MKDLQKRGELALSAFMLEHAPWPVVVLGDDGAIIAWSRGARDRSAEIAWLFDPERRDRARASFLTALDTVGSAARIELARVLDDGRELSLSLFGVNLDGWRVVGVDDLTERRELEGETRMLRRIESIGLLTARLAHDLNNLLTPMICLSESLAESLAGSSAEPQIREIEASAQRANALLRDMLALGRRGSHAAATDVNEVVRDLYAIAERLLGDHAELVLALDASLPTARLDRARLEHALLNLVANARDAIEGSGRVVIGTRNESSLDPETGDAVSRIVLTVSDDGAGMSDAVRARVFEQVFTTKASGTGLGLASVYAFVRESGGMVAIDSAPGRGTAVAIYLPSLEGRRARTESGTVPSAGDDDTGGVVLLIDPDSAARTAARAALESRGLRVLETCGGAHGFAMARGAPIDVALIDLAVLRDDPGLDERLRAAAPHLRVVWMTADHEPVRPIGRVIEKPFSDLDVARAVRDALLVGRPV